MSSLLPVKAIIKRSSCIFRRGRQAGLHRCLLIDEILEVIARYVLDGGDGERSLASLALTCRALYDTPMSVLWERMDMLLPLFRLIPGHIWFHLPGDTRWDIAHPCVNLNPDLTRLRHYTHRVRYITWRQNRMLTGAVAHCIAHIPLNEQLFPRLRSFELGGILPHIRRINPPLLPDPELLVGPQLRELRLEEALSDTALFCNILRTVRIRCQDLTVIHLTFPKCEGTLQMLVILPVLAELLSVVSLIEFKSDGITPAIGFLSLAEMTHLKHASLILLADNISSCVAKLPYAAFLALETLELKFTRLDISSLRLLQSVNSNRLRRLVIYIGRHSSAHMFTEHLDALVRIPSRFSLVEVEWVFHCRGLDSPHEPPMTIDTLRPLLQVPNLVNITITCSIPLALDTEALYVLATTWPHLKKLHLKPEVATSVSVPLKGLVVFAQHCPNLEELGLCIDAADVPDLPPHWKSTAQLKCLRSCSPSEPNPRADDYVVALFPALGDEDPLLQRLRRKAVRGLRRLHENGWTVFRRGEDGNSA